MTPPTTSTIYEIAPLAWEENRGCFYAESECTGVKYEVWRPHEHNGDVWEWQCSEDFGGMTHGPYESASQAKESADRHHQKRMLKGLTARDAAKGVGA